jgi:WD40 repeat protein
MQAHEGEVLACAVTADGNLGASAGEDDSVRLWRLPELTPLAILRGHQWTVTGCAFSADGTLLVSVGGNGTACLWDTAAARAGQPTGTANS